MRQGAALTFVHSQWEQMNSQNLAMREWQVRPVSKRRGKEDKLPSNNAPSQGTGQNHITSVLPQRAAAPQTRRCKCAFPPAQVLASGLLLPKQAQRRPQGDFPELDCLEENE